MNRRTTEFGEPLTKQKDEPIKLVLPDNAERAWFNDDGTMREGYILPDGSMYMLDKYGLITKVITNSPSNKTKFEELLAKQTEVLDKNEPYTPLEPIYEEKDIKIKNKKPVFGLALFIIDIVIIGLSVGSILVITPL